MNDANSTPQKKFFGEVKNFSQKGMGVVIDSQGNKYFCALVIVGDKGVFEEITPYQELPRHYKMCQLVELTTPSPIREEPACLHWGDCQGCPWMIMPYTQQLHYKMTHLTYALERLKIKLGPQTLKPIIPSPQIFQYRNRGQLKTDGQKLGNVHPRTKEIVDLKECLVLTPLNQKKFVSWKSSLPRNDWTPGQGHRWNYLDFDETSDILNPQLNKRRPFAQGNSFQNEQMKKWLKEKVSFLQNDDVITEFFCGSGNLTEVLVHSNAEKITAIEVQGSALQELKEKKISKCSVVAQDLFQKDSWRIIEDQIKTTTVWVLDPPREGLQYQRAWPKVMPHLHTIIYISCEIDSFTKDTREFYKLGFELVELTPLDMFPHTPHIEILSVFKRVIQH